MPGPGLLSDGWFREESSMWPGQGQGLKVEKVLFDDKTKFQHLTVFESDPKGPWGTIMTLDGAIQFTDYDEFVYHEMLANLSLCCHKKPQKVLILGGGDGGVLREVLRHKTEDGNVQSVELCDIDGEVINQSKIHFPQIASGLSDPCVKVIVGDAAEYVQNAHDNEYDIIIIDTTDPEGPASELFGAEFYKNVIRILRPRGVMCNQGESVWLHRPLIEKMMKFMKETVGFSTVKYAIIYIPTYPCGSIGSFVCTKDASINVLEPLRPVEALGFAKDLKYYSTEIHKAAFVLPRFAAYLNE